MAPLTVFKLDNPTGAAQFLEKIKTLQKQQLIQLQDAAVVTWPADKDKPKTKQAVNLAGVGALDGAFWGMLFGLIFFVPWFGMAVGAAFGALGGKMADYGIDGDFIESVREQVTEVTSAAFLLTDKAVRDKVADELKSE